MLISIVIPTLNEALCIEQTLASLETQEGPYELIVTDGGSTDGTVELARKQAKVVTGTPGRAAQMNRGAAYATGTVLLFLHADTLLPAEGLAAIRRAMTSAGYDAGAFRLSFDADAPLLRFYGRCTHLPWGRICFGDRGLFVRRDLFNRVGGYPDIPLFEDLEMVRLLRKQGRFQFLPLAVTTAARRFTRNGLLRQQLRNFYLWSHYMLGSDPHRLKHLYAYN